MKGNARVIEYGDVRRTQINKRRVVRFCLGLAVLVTSWTVLRVGPSALDYWEVRRLMRECAQATADFDQPAWDQAATPPTGGPECPRMALTLPGVGGYVTTSDPKCWLRLTRRLGKLDPGHPAILYCGPMLLDGGSGRWVIVSVGPARVGGESCYEFNFAIFRLPSSLSFPQSSGSGTFRCRIDGGAVGPDTHRRVLLFAGSLDPKDRSVCVLRFKCGSRDGAVTVALRSSTLGGYSEGLRVVRIDTGNSP